MILDPVYFLFIAPGLLLALWASFKTKGTFRKYAQVGARSGLTGAEAARQMLNYAGVTDVKIEPVQGFLTDHYDPRANALRLSPEVYHAHSLAAIGVACHEAGHALQKAQAYGPLTLRSALVPVTSFGSSLAMPIFFIGMLVQIPFLIQIGILLFVGVVAFSIVTLPVEWDASARAKQLMVRAGIVTDAEQVHAGRVLNAAFLTYLAAAIQAVLTLAYLLLRARD